MSKLNSYQLLLNKLDAFIRKFYLNQIIRGSLFSLALIGGIFLVFSLLESQFYFSPEVRKVLFYSFIGISGVALARWVALPALHYFRLGQTISHEQAATIIGQHFSNVSDKLLNILQLRRQSDSLSDTSLIQASIQQKSDEIKLVPFPKAINLAKNKKYLRYALPPLLLIFGILLTAPSMITEPTQRIIRNNEEFAPEAPFSFVITNESLEVPQYDNFLLTVKTEGSAYPEEVFISLDNTRYRLSPSGDGNFSYQFNTVQSDIDFKLVSGRVESETKSLKVLLKPQLASFSAELDYPRYTGYKDEFQENIGDLTLPEGTKVTWTFDTEYTDDLNIRFGSSASQEVERRGSDAFIYSTTLRRSTAYTTTFQNDVSGQQDSVQYSINIIPDQYPSIDMETFEDSTDNAFLFFAGQASDDYGLSKLNFHYRVQRYKADAEAWVISPIAIDRQKAIQYDHQLLLGDLDLRPGDEVEYFFEVYDNDGVNGAKASRTGTSSYALATPEELEEKTEENSKEIKNKLEDNIKKAQDIQKQLEELRQKMLNSKTPSWQDKQRLEDLMQQQQQLREQFEQAKQQFQENLKNQEALDQNHEEIMEKQEKLQELFEEVVDEEMQELMEEIQKLMEELEKEGSIKQMEDMKMTEEELEKEMDRLLELYKQLELEKELRDQIEKLEELAKKQEELAEKTKNEEDPSEKLKEEQEEINKEFEEMQEKMEELEKKNEELEKPKDIDDPSEKMEDIKKDMDKASDDLEKQNSKSASKSQKKAADKMKEMASGMQQQMAASESQQAEEDIQVLRQLLENLVSLSFDQEDLVFQVSRTNPSTPRYVELVQVQSKLEDDFQLISDSLSALAKRNFQIEAFITDKVNEVSGWFVTTVDQLEERSKGKAGEGQRQIMKNVNDLALMLSESLNKMQQQMASMMQGNQMCNNPGGSGKDGKIPMDKVSDGQKKLGDQLQKMKDGKKDGQGGQSAKDFAQAAARQAAMRRALEALQKEKQEKGQGSPELQDLIDQMDKMEIDLINKRLDNEVLKRQMDIETRLLKAEKAERQREFDEKRKSNTAQEVERKLPPSLEKYLKEREAEIELYQKVSPELRPYYKALVEEYYKALK